MDFDDSKHHSCPNTPYSFLGCRHSEVIYLGMLDGADRSCLAAVVLVLCCYILNHDTYLYKYRFVVLLYVHSFFT